MRDRNKANTILIVCSAIWGFTFVLQKIGSQHLEPFSFNAIRFLIGFLTILPFALKRKGGFPFKESIFAGGLLFTAISMQQIGVEFTSTGNAAFITGLYVIIIPLISVACGQKISSNNWVAGGLSLCGLYLICGGASSISNGDLIILVSSFVWAFQVIYIASVSRKVDVIQLAAGQFFICCVFSLIVSASFESFQYSGFVNCWEAVVAVGVISTGLAYTLQIKGQSGTTPETASVIMSFEAVFALAGGMLFLNETITMQILGGCLIMLAAMIISQLPPKKEEAHDIAL